MLRFFYVLATLGCAFVIYVGMFIHPRLVLLCYKQTM